MAQLYGFLGHKTSRIREALACRGAKTVCDQLLSLAHRVHVQVSRFRSSPVTWGKIKPTIGFEKSRNARSRKKRRNVEDSFVVSKCSARKGNKVWKTREKKSLLEINYAVDVYIQIEERIRRNVDDVSSSSGYLLNT